MDENRDEAVDFVLAEIGSSSSENALLPVQDQGGEKHAFCHEQNKVKLDLFIMSVSVGRLITFLDHTRARFSVFSARNWGRSCKNCTC